MIAWALACAGKLPPVPAVALAPAPAYTTGEAPSSDEERALLASVASATGELRADDGLQRLAWRVLDRWLETGALPEGTALDGLADEASVPAVAWRYAVGVSSERLLGVELVDALRSERIEGRVAVGLARVSRGQNVGWAFVFAPDVVTLVEPVPRVAVADVPLAVRWEGAPLVLATIGPDGLSSAPLERYEDGVWRGALPAPGATGSRHDLVAGGESGLVIAQLDLRGPDGALPPVPPLADGTDPVARILTTLGALRVSAGLPPLTVVDAGASCDAWPTEVSVPGREGVAWVRTDQACWSIREPDLATAWAQSAARPSFRAGIADPGLDLVDVDTGEGFSVHLLGSFERLEPAAGADRLASALAARWPAAERVAAAAWLQDRVNEIAADDTRSSAIAEAIAAAEPPFAAPDGAIEVVCGAAQTLEGLVEVVGEGTPPSRFALAFADGRDAAGEPYHYAIVVATR